MGKKKNAKYVIGVDLGGTKIYAAVIDRNDKMRGSARKKTKAENGFESTVKRVVSCIENAVEDAGITLDQIVGIGVGSPGPLDLKEGKIIETPNLKWKDAPLKARLESALGKPVKIDNDGNVGILGEYACGAAMGAKHVIGLFVGTGVGGGVIVNGEVLHGFNENAGELGHIILDPNGPKCGCGNNGCLEAFSSRLSIEREIRTAKENGIKTAVFDGVADKNELIRSKRLAEFFHANDPAVKMAIEKSATYIGFAVASLLNIFNPQIVVIGGGVVEALGESYVSIVRNVAEANVFAIAKRNVRIVPAQLKDDSAVLGAAVLGWQAAQEKKKKNDA